MKTIFINLQWGIISAGLVLSLSLGCAATQKNMEEEEPTQKNEERVPPSRNKIPPTPSTIPGTPMM